MKKTLRLIALGLFLTVISTVTGQTSKVQFKVVYNAGSGLYEAHALVVGPSLTFPSTIPYPSKFTVVVPSSVSNDAFTVVQNVNPPGVSWAQANTICAPAAAPGSDFHAFTSGGGGGTNAYPEFKEGGDILLFTFTLPGAAVAEGVRCYINGVDPNSAQPGMAGIDFTQAFKTFQLGVPSGANHYKSSSESPAALPRPNTTGVTLALDESVEK